MNPKKLTVRLWVYRALRADMHFVNPKTGKMPSENSE
jgi:hypothetical protein